MHLVDVREALNLLIYCFYKESIMDIRENPGCKFRLNMSKCQGF